MVKDKVQNKEGGYHVLFDVQFYSGIQCSKKIFSSGFF